ncbi:uncharacterized protein [Palaemon carinicauda]|uniref:uncharacterized protein n=1 Tax=Palaemon carinicauda TaxID=392227 RepID=UPI0035B680F6
MRIVLNVSAKLGPNSRFLDESLNKSPYLASKIQSMILWYRKRPFALTADISKGFLRIKIAQEHRDYCRCLFFKDSSMSEVVACRFKVVLFGITLNPYLLNQTIQHHLDAQTSSLSSQLKARFYVDNFQRCYDSAMDILSGRLSIEKNMLEANMPLAKWTTNAPISGDFTETGPQNYLSLDWNTADDTLAKLWKMDQSWDSRLSEELIRELGAILKKYKGLENIKVPQKAHQGHQAALHVFADASKQAFGVASYVVTIEGKCQLLTAKARVIPKHMLELDEMWSDDSTALQWVHNRQRTSLYVLNRVEEINRTRLNCWLLLKHVPMSCNPTDLASQGVAAKVVLKSNLWLHGPAWLIDFSAYPDQSRFPSEWEIKACPIRLLAQQTQRFAHFSSLDEAVRSYAALLRLTSGWAEHKFPHLVHRFPRTPITAIICVSQVVSYPQILQQLAR